MKRFWDQAQAVAQGAHYAVQLDGRPMRLPGGPHLVLHSAALAEAIAAEWQAAGGGKGGQLTADDVPLTRLAGTAQERVAPDPAATMAALARYAESDVLCYWAEAPQNLVQRQALLWQPWLDWTAATYGAQLVVVQGLMGRPQPPGAVAALRAALERLPPGTLAGLGVLVPALGSLVLGLAVAEGALGAEEAHRLALLDELFQAEQWGEDREAMARRRAVLEDVVVAARFIALSA